MKDLIIANGIKAIIIGNSGTLAGMVYIVNLATSNIQFAMTSPLITVFKIDEAAFKIYICTEINKIIINHYIPILQYGIKRTVQNTIK